MDTNEYLVGLLARDRLAEAHAWARGRAICRAAAAERPALDTRIVRRFRITNLGRLALAGLVVTILGLGVVGLWAAATELRPSRAGAQGSLFHR